LGLFLFPTWIGTLMAVGATGQCSPNPLYYVVQELSLNTLVNTFDASILWKYRAVSLGSCFLLMALLVFCLNAQLGIFPAVMGLLALSNAGIFQVYSAENRPYLLWVLFFAASFFWTSQSKNRGRGFWALGIGLLTGLSSVSGGGGPQALAFLSGRWWVEKREWKKTIGLGVLVGAIAFFYGRFACHYTDAEQFDLLNTGNLRLVSKVTSLVFNGSTHPIAVVFDVLFLTGVIFPFFRKATRALPITETTFNKVNSLHLHLCLQLAASVAIGALVALKHYYFIDRVFIFLIFLKAVGIAVGFFLLLQVIKRKITSLPSANLVAYQCVGVCTLIGFMTPVMIAFGKERVNLVNAAHPAIVFTLPAGAECSDLDPEYEAVIEKKTLPEDVSNSIVGFSRLIKSCQLKSSGKGSGVGFVKIYADHRLEFSPTRFPSDEGFAAITQFGRSLSIR
jgi:hypothetical protein